VKGEDAVEEDPDQTYSFVNVFLEEAVKNSRVYESG